VGSKGDKRRAKQRRQQFEESRRRSGVEHPPDRVPKPKPEPAAKRQSNTTAGERPKWLGPPKPPDPESPDGPLTPRKVSEGQYLTMEWPPRAPAGSPSVRFAFKITKKTLNISNGTLTFDMVPSHDTIHPRQLSYDPPLQQYGKDGAKGFRHYWEKLDYVFGLPDPYAFPQLPIEGEYRDSLVRYIEMCRRLARFSIINDDTRLFSRLEPGNRPWHIQVLDYPNDESFLGASAAFRQLHNDGEPACFTNAHNVLFKMMKTLPEDQQSAIKDTVLQWRSARGNLMNHTLHTLTALKAANATPDKPVSFGNVSPDELIRTFNYGDSLHFGDAREQLDDLLADPRCEAYYKYAALLSIVGLSHLYFGFSVLLDSALGGV
jgi:hypothetical protein